MSENMESWNIIIGGRLKTTRLFAASTIRLDVMELVETACEFSFLKTILISASQCICVLNLGRSSGASATRLE